LPCDEVAWRRFRWEIPQKNGRFHGKIMEKYGQIMGKYWKIIGKYVNIMGKSTINEASNGKLAISNRLIFP
jgi:hypothetical protein